MQAERMFTDVGDRRYPEFPELSGTWRHAFGNTHSCRAALLSMSAARMVSSTKPTAGDEVTVSLSAFNPVTGKVRDILDDGFVLDLSGIPIDDLIELALFARHAGMTNEHEERAHFRVIPKQKLARIDMLNGRETFSRIIDVSRAGIAIETLLLDKGNRVEVGGRSGVVVRTWEHGAAIQFDEVIDTGVFTDQISFR